MWSLNPNEKWVPVLHLGKRGKPSEFADREEKNVHGSFQRPIRDRALREQYAGETHFLSREIVNRFGAVFCGAW